MTPRFGIFLSAQHPPAMSASQIARDCCEQVRLARELGLDDVSAGQHFLTQPYQMLQLVPLLARIAAEAGEMRVGAGILLLTLLNPVEVAENAATLDAITDGRFVLGLGLGYRQEENDAFGLPREAPGRVRAEARRRPAPARGRGRDRRGPRLPARATSSSRCARRSAPRPPIWLAANNDNAVLRAARLADAWLLNPHTKLDELERQLVPLPRRARALRPAARGRDPDHQGAPRRRATTSPRCAPCGRTSRTSTRPTCSGARARCCPRATPCGRPSSSSREGGRFIVGGPETLRPPGARARRAPRRDELPVPLPVAGHAAGARARLDAARRRGGLPAALRKL